MKRQEMRAVVLSPGVVRGTLGFISIEKMYHRLSAGKNSGTTEIEKLQKSVGEVVDELESLAGILESENMHSEASIIRTHVLFLRDPEFQKKVCYEIQAHLVSAETALERALIEFSEAMVKAGNPLLSERIMDFKDIVLRVRMKMSETAQSLFAELGIEARNHVAALEELFPSVVLEAKKWGIQGLIVGRGTHLSHAAIMAKSFGIPAVKIESIEQLKAWNGSEVLIDGEESRVVLEPGAGEAPSMLPPLSLPARMDLPVKVWLNVTDPELLKGDWTSAAEGIGLYRTEVLFMQNEADFPSEEEQYVVYRRLFSQCVGFPVTIRTLDIGGDKTLPHFSMGPQENPYMGLRAHRVYRFHPELFISQMKAILRAKLAGSELRILYPMVGDADELSFIQGLVRKALRSLRSSGTGHTENFLQGILLEVPGAVWNLENLLGRIDFISVGTNDLLQFFLACDRNNANVSASCRPENPGFLRMLKYIVDTAKRFEKKLSICGEMAADADFTPVLIGLGFEHISVDVHSLRTVTQALARLNVESCTALARDCMSARSTSEARNLMNRFNGNSMQRGVPFREETNDVDPVCGMVVFTADNHLSAFRRGRRYYFCSKGCMDRFSSEKVQKGARK